MAERQRLGRAIRRERLARGMTIESAAKSAGMALKTLSRIESGPPVREQNIAKLDGLLGLPPGSALAAWQGDADLETVFATATTATATGEADTERELQAALDLVPRLPIPQLERLQTAVDTALRIRRYDRAGR